MSDLKPCPFCPTGVGVERYYPDRGDELICRVECSHNCAAGRCHAATNMMASLELAREAWNTRPAEDVKDATIAALEEEVETLKARGLECENGWSGTLRDNILLHFDYFTDYDKHPELHPEGRAVAMIVMRALSLIGKQDRQIAALEARVAEKDEALRRASCVIQDAMEGNRMPEQYDLNQIDAALSTTEADDA